MDSRLHYSLLRYDAMAGLVSWTDEADPGREERDRRAYDREYGLIRQNGQDYTCYGRVVRFLTEVCGHSFDESVDGLVEYVREQPTGGRRMDLDAGREAQQIRANGGNIIEALFSLKVGRLIDRDDDFALDYNWQVTRRLMGLRGRHRRRSARRLAPALPR